MCVRSKLTLTSGCGGTELNPSPVRENGTRPRRLSVTAARVPRYRVLRGASRGVLRSVDRECAGRNALSGVKVSSPDNPDLTWR